MYAVLDYKISLVYMVVLFRSCLRAENNGEGRPEYLNSNVAASRTNGSSPGRRQTEPREGLRASQKVSVMKSRAEKMLVVESEDALREQIVAVLSDAGYEVSADYGEGMKA